MFELPSPTSPPAKAASANSPADAVPSSHLDMEDLVYPDEPLWALKVTKISNHICDWWWLWLVAPGALMVLAAKVIS
jgi:outer membrane PBP1 activator LpoA protein